VCFELLPEGRDGSLVLGKAHFKVCEQDGMLLGQLVDGSQWMMWVYMPLKGAG
jgi:hypothetical protein